MSRMRHIRYVLKDRETTLFVTKPEKGTREWNIFRALRSDLARRGTFLVAVPHAHRH